MPTTSLIIGASRGLGLSLVQALHARGDKVYATVRSPPTPGTLPEGVIVIDGVDVGEWDAGERIVRGLAGEKVGLVIVNAGYFKSETIDSVSYDDELQMYKTVAIGPVVITQHLIKSSSFLPSAKFILITTEGGSIALRTREEGGGQFGHHGSKAAANMVGKLLAFDLEKIGVTAVMIHPGFMRTDMTKAVGYDKFYEVGGAVTPDEAASSLLSFVQTVTPEHAGTFWAPRGPRDIGEADRVLGKDLPTPLQLPW